MLTPLIGFGDAAQQAQLSISADARLRQGTLNLVYEVRDDLSSICWPIAAQNSNPARRDELWKTTCFEAFLLIGDGPAYFEFNLSPSGDWNAYRFSGYRDGMKPLNLGSELVRPPRVRVEREAGLSRIHAELELAANDIRRAGLTAVIERDTPKKNERLSYWALVHPGAQPDFHRADSFFFRFT
ncbi:MAG: DOMON-like domain-containing protein [Oligoflexia bacterium]|nr:DOMON-like domain-containing protein [Oligoflexia bacterium]